MPHRNMHATTTPSSDTVLTRVGRTASPDSAFVYANPPLVRASTVLAGSLREWRSRAALPTHDKPTAAYGRFGTPTTQAFESAIAELESAHRALCFPSGLAACTMALLALAPPGSHVLMTQNVYWPVREFAETTMVRLGCTVEFFSEIDADGIAARFRANTSVVYLESPGSLTFEVCDVDHIAARCHAAGIRMVMDNTWATPLLFRPLEHGVDVSVQSATKYICGHSDCILGVAACNADTWREVAGMATRFGQTASPDDLYQGLRGLRTLGVRMRQHSSSATYLAHWLAARHEVMQVCSPVIEGHPGHAAWKRLYDGASGVFSFVLRPVPEPVLAAFFDQLAVFGIGLSWGGFESLVVPVPSGDSLAMRATAGCGQLVRIAAGLEAVEDLARDLHQAFDAMNLALASSTPAKAA
ncbi:MAG: cystathionine beta-lyase [Comamonadaceae bacterium]|nr:MAG: cystathionine beta-lyase [Comamonadaceae bacterium]